MYNTGFSEANGKWKNNFCCKSIEFGAVQKGGETLFEKFVKYMEDMVWDIYHCQV